MTERTTLLAYLTPKLTSQVEDAATNALAFILNESPKCLDALNDLLRDEGFDLESIERVETQVTDEDGSRPDMIGYDRIGGKRLVVEVKFWAALRRGQARDYFDQIDEDNPGCCSLSSRTAGVKPCGERSSGKWARPERDLRVMNPSMVAGEPESSVRTTG